MTSKVSAEDIFNLPEDDGHSDASDYDSEEERELKASSTNSKMAGLKKPAPAKKNALVFGLDQSGDSDDDNDDDDDDDNNDNSGDDDEREDGSDTTAKDPTASSDPRFQMEGADENDSTEPKRIRGAKKSKKVKPLTPKALEKFQAARDKTGIVYLSKIPPFMKPVKLRHLLGKFGELGRVYLAPEDPKIAARRKKYGGNKKQNFTEGWVEFMDKSVAKQVAKTLNTTIIGGNKNSFYYDDMWNIKYLPKFKWDHLTERIAYENASRAQRLQAEISQANRENKFILNNIEKSKMIKSMEEKKAAKRKATEGDSSSSNSNSGSGK
ncbi:RNA-binding ATPase activator esf2, partial [Gamsiella multidivaricata]